MSDWQKVKIGEFLFEREGKYKPRDEVFIGLSRIEKIDFNGNFHIGNKKSNTNMILIKPGDLVISGINVAKGAMGIYSGSTDVTATIHYSSYTFNENKINVEYFKRFLKSSAFIDLLKEQIRGGIKTEIKPKHILPLEIQLPDISEQGKIVSHFKSIESEDDDLKNEISHQQTLLKKLRQAILQEAIEGKLTKHWRKENPSVEPASVLLKKIKTEKARLVAEKKIKKAKPLSPIEQNEMPFEIPETWAWCRLGKIILGNPRNGLSKKAVTYKTNTKTLKLGATTYGFFDNTQFKYLDIEIEKESYLWLQDGDILIQRSNSIQYVGMSVVYNGGDNSFIYPDLMIKVKCSKYMSELFLQYYLVSPFCRNYFQQNASGSQQSMPKINQGIVVNTKVSLPPLVEQKEIVKKVDHLFAMCDELERQIKDSKANADILMQAVLKEAFEY